MTVAHTRLMPNRLRFVLCTEPRAVADGEGLDSRVLSVHREEWARMYERTKKGNATSNKPLYSNECQQLRVSLYSFLFTFQPVTSNCCCSLFWFFRHSKVPFFSCFSFSFSFFICWIYSKTTLFDERNRSDEIGPRPFAILDKIYFFFLTGDGYLPHLCQ